MCISKGLMRFLPFTDTVSYVSVVYKPLCVIEMLAEQNRWRVNQPPRNGWFSNMISNAHSSECLAKALGRDSQRSHRSYIRIVLPPHPPQHLLWNEYLYPPPQFTC